MPRATRISWSEPADLREGVEIIFDGVNVNATVFVLFIALDIELGIKRVITGRRIGRGKRPCTQEQRKRKEKTLRPPGVLYHREIIT